MTKILCIDDEADFRENISDFLSSEGFEIIQANDGEEGLEKFTKEKPDLVISDVRMPKMSGFQMLDKAKEHIPEYVEKTPILFVSALTQKDDVLRGTKMGADDYIYKPVDFDVLLARIESRLKRQKDNTMKHDLSGKKAVRLFSQLLKEYLGDPADNLCSYVQLMEKKLAKISLTDEQKNNLEALRNCSDLLANKISVASNVCELMSGDYEPNIRTFDLNELVSAITLYFQMDYQLSDTEIRYIAPKQTLSTSVQGDANLLECALYLLLAHHLGDYPTIIEVQTDQQDTVELTAWPMSLKKSSASFERYNSQQELFYSIPENIRYSHGVLLAYFIEIVKMLQYQLDLAIHENELGIRLTIPLSK